MELWYNLLNFKKVNIFHLEVHEDKLFKEINRNICAEASPFYSQSNQN